MPEKTIEESIYSKFFYCVTCNKSTFKPPKSHREKTCSYECLMKLRSKIFNKRISKNCLLCNNKFDCPPSQSYTRFCNKKCVDIWKSTEYKGRKQTKEWTEKITKSKFRDAYRKEGIYPCDRCEKIFDSNTSVRAHKSYCGIDIVKAKCEICKKNFKSDRGRKLHNTLIHLSSDEVQSQRSSKIREKCFQRPFRLTSIGENEFANKIKKLCSDAICSFSFNDHFHKYDLYIPSLNLIIEYDGDYWHGNPSTQFEVTDRIKKQIKTDFRHSIAAIERNKKLIRVWESECEQFLEEFKKAYENGNQDIKDFINKKSWSKTSF